MGIFIGEIVLKWYSGFVIFWKDYWNILDFSVILVLHVSTVSELGANASGIAKQSRWFVSLILVIGSQEISLSVLREAVV